MIVDAPGLLLGALLGAEVAAVGLAVRHAGQVPGSPSSPTHMHGPSCPGGKQHSPPQSSGRSHFACGIGSESGGSSKRLSSGMPRLLCIVRAPLVALLAFALVDEVVLALLHAFLFEGAPRPLAGWARLGWHVETIFVLGWPAALAWACGSSSTSSEGAKPAEREHEKRRGLFQNLASARNVSRLVRLLPGLYLGAVVFLVLAYPPPRAFLRWLYLAWEVLCVALAWRGIWRGRRRPWGPADVALVVLVSCETMVALVGPFASDPFTRWWIARAFYLAAWGAVIVLLARARRPA